jgi:tetratricopeptide (TPR) repeat protein
MHLERALDVAARLPLVPAEVLARWIELGDVRERAGHFGEALDAYARATDFLPPDPVARAELLLRRARVHERAGAYGTALRTASRARGLVNGSDGPDAASIRAEALAFSALVRQRQEHAALAWRVAEEALEAGQAALSRSAQARASNVMSWAAMMLGRPEAIELAERSLRLYEEIGDADGQADLANNLGIMAYFDGRWDETLERYEQSRRACERVGNLLDAASTEANIGEVLVNQRRIGEAEPVLQDASRVLRSSGHRWGAAFAEMHLGRVAMLAGEPERAVEMLKATRDEFASMGRAASVYETSIHLADALTNAGRAHEALVVLEASNSLAGEEVAIFDAARARVNAAALLAVGDAEEAQRVLESGISIARERGLGYELGLMLAAAAAFPRPVETGSDEPPAIESARLLTDLGVVALSPVT